MERSLVSRYELRVLLWSWGLLVDLDLSVHTADTEPSGGIRVAWKVWLVVASAGNVWDDEMPRLVSGLRRVSQRVRAAKADPDQELVFVLNHLWYPSTDFQEDALELAVAGWAVQELGVLGDPAAISFDRANNRYVIEFDKELWELTP
jgi:hypothetical protein